MAHLGDEQPLEDDVTTSLKSAVEVEEEKEKRLPFRDLVKQVLIACIIHSVVIQAGINLSFSAVLLPQLQTSNETNISLDKDSASWIASLVTLSLPLGALTVGSLMDNFGRKRIAILTNLPFIVGWLLHRYAVNIYMIYAARIIAGFGSGLSTVCLIYVAELAHPQLRAMLLSLNSLFVCFGILLTCAIGGTLHWRTMALSYAVLATSSALSISVLLPESPHWLHTFHSTPERASGVLSWLYSSPEHFRREQKRLNETRLLRPTASFPRSYCEPQVRKPLLLLFVLFLLQQLTGCYVIVFYAVDVFKMIGDGIAEYRALLVLGLIRFIAAIISSVTSLKVGRKVLMAVSASGMLVSALLAASSSVGVVTSWCVLAYVACGSCGVLVIPWTLIGELLPLQVRGKLGGFLFALAYLFMFALVKGFPYLTAVVHMRTLFYVLAAINGLIVYFVCAWMPETLGKSFGEIEAHFR